MLLSPGADGAKRSDFFIKIIIIFFLSDLGSDARRLTPKYILTNFKNVQDLGIGGCTMKRKVWDFSALRELNHLRKLDLCTVLELAADEVRIIISYTS
jgi:hypothetical protein